MGCTWVSGLQPHVQVLPLVPHLGPVSTQTHICLSVVKNHTPCDNSSGRKGWQIRGYDPKTGLAVTSHSKVSSKKLGNVCTKAVIMCV